MPDGHGLIVSINLPFDPTRPGEAGRFMDILSYLATELAKRGVVAPVYSPDPPADTDEPDTLVPAPVGPSASPVQPPKRVRDRTAERRAAREKAEVEAKAKQAQGNGAEADDGDPMLGGAAPGTGDPFGDDVEDEPPPAKPVVQDRVRTPKECMDGSIVLLRQCFARGGSDQVKALQKTYKVSKFIDLPLDAAPGLWKESLALANSLKITIPPGL